MIVTRAGGTVISRLTVVAIGNGVVRSSSLALLKENGGSSELTKDWGQGVLQSIKWDKRKVTTVKIEPLSEKLIFQRKISVFIIEHDVSKELIKNLDQTLLPYVSADT